MLGITVTMMYTFFTTSYELSSGIVDEDGCGSRFGDLREIDSNDKL